MPQAQKKPIRTEYIAMALLCVLIAVFVVILIIVSSYKNSHGEESAQTVSEQTSSEVSGDASRPDQSPEPSSESSQETVGTVQIASSGKTEGILALTQKPAENRVAETPSDLVTVSKYYNKKFGLSGTSLELKKDAVDALNALTAAFAEAKGQTNIMADKCYVPYELLTDRDTQLDLTAGYSVLLSIYPRDPDGDTLGSGKFSWLPDNCTTYGYILRYPPEKKDLTGVEGSQRIYRYVGYAHASYMGKYHLCLEEYLSQIKNATLEQPIEFTYTNSSGEEKECAVYYCAASSEDTSRVKVPEGANYSISGNGTDGFVVTIYK